MAQQPQRPHLTRHDLLLGGMAASLTAAGVLAATTGVSLAVALAGGSLPAGLGLGYGLFYRPPSN